MVRFCLQVHATAHDVFPTVIKEKETIKSIMVPVEDPNVEGLEEETPAATYTRKPTSLQSSFYCCELVLLMYAHNKNNGE